MEANVQSTSFKTRYFGDKAFYKMVLTVAVPIMIQNGITNFVSLLDNIMIGRIGTEQMSGAAIVNQLLFVYILCMFGGMSGAGIFTAQYYGQKDMEGVRQTTRYKFWMGSLLTLAGALLLLTRGNSLIGLYLTGEGEAGSAGATLAYSRQYLHLMLLGLPAFMLTQAYASTLRECGETMLPMKAGISAVLVNLCFNYLLIYGKFGFPVLGVRGAAIATVLSRYVELGIILWWARTHVDQMPYLQGLFRTLAVPPVLVRKILVKGSPLLLNEALWSAGIAMLTQCYSIRGLNVVAGINISSTISNLFNVVYIALGDSVAIVVGQLLGAGKMEEAKQTDRKMIVFSVLCCSGIALVMLLAAPLFPKLYNTNPEARQLAAQFIQISALFMPMNAFLHATYFTLRSGGRTIITFLFDSVFMWGVSVTIAYGLTRFTDLPVVTVFTLVTAADFIKCLIGYGLVKKGVWLQNIVS